MHMHGVYVCKRRYEVEKRKRDQESSDGEDSSEIELDSLYQLYVLFQDKIVHYDSLQKGKKPKKVEFSVPSEHE